jgi:hypothetical protein
MLKPQGTLTQSGRNDLSPRAAVLPKSMKMVSMGYFIMRAKPSEKHRCDLI